MKRILCLVLCFMMAASLVYAETTDTLSDKFERQLIVGGNGIRGYARITASGVAEWLNLLLPFTATDIQIRAIGERQGEKSAQVTDDDDWQVRFYVNNSAGQEVGNTWLFGNPEGIYFQSELLPGTTLMIPVEQVNLLYQLLSGDFENLFFAFDPLGMTLPGAQDNVSAYEAVAKLMGISEEEWNEKWMPVMEKYFLHLDLWMTGYGDPSFVTGEAGTLTMSATYQIPVEDIKAEAKYIVGQMLYDTDLQNLLLPYVSMEQRMTYLNPNLVYFYEACIDALPLDGDISLAREMSAQGEVVSAKISLPLPPLPETVTEPLGEMMVAVWGDAYKGVFAGAHRIEVEQNGDARMLRIYSKNCTIILELTVSKPDETTTAVTGSLQVIPVGGDLQAVYANVECSVGHRLWQDEKYIDHDTSTLHIAMEPAATEGGVDFAPVSFTWTMDYRNNAYQENSPVQINYNLDVQMADAAVQAEIVLRISTAVKMTELQVVNTENVNTMPEARQTELVETFVSNAVLIMAGLNGDPVEADAPSADAAAEPTAVPPIAE